MTNNHCPDEPARAFTSPANRAAIHEFAENILERITDFASTFSMDNGIRIHPDILDNWMDCNRCEAGIMDIDDKVNSAILDEIKAYLNANF